MIQSDNEQFVTYIDVTYTVQTPNTIDINSCCCYAGKIQIKFGLILVEKKRRHFQPARQIFNLAEPQKKLPSLSMRIAVCKIDFQS